MGFLGQRGLKGAGIDVRSEGEAERACRHIQARAAAQVSLIQVGVEVGDRQLRRAPVPAAAEVLDCEPTRLHSAEPAIPIQLIRFQLCPPGPGFISAGRGAGRGRGEANVELQLARGAPFGIRLPAKKLAFAPQRNGIGQGVDPLSVKLRIGGAAPFRLDVSRPERQISADQIRLARQRGAVHSELQVGGTAPFSLDAPGAQGQVAIAQIGQALERGHVGTELQVPGRGPTGVRLFGFQAQLGAGQSVGGSGIEARAKPPQADGAPGGIRAGRAQQHAHAEAGEIARVAPDIKPEGRRSGEAYPLHQVGELTQPVAPGVGRRGLIGLQHPPFTNGGCIGHRAG